MDEHPSLAPLDKLRMRIQALRAKTIDNGCTEDEALSAAAKVAELLDRYDLARNSGLLHGRHVWRERVALRR